MGWERLIDHISILVVDDDVTSLNIVASLLTTWEYKVLTANSARNALETLREFEGFFDLVITELHISGINGFEFQKLVKDQFHLPVIMMSADRRKSVMSKSIENGASHFLLKPLCADDFRDIWQFATPDPTIANDVGGNQIVVHGTNSSQPRQKRKYTKRNKSDSQMIINNNNMEDHDQEGASKRSKVVWTANLHNRFLMAIRCIGVGKIVPTKILEVMNVPYLTRENVASHLQKYRLFLKKVRETGMIEPLSERELRSRFASELPVSMIREIQKSGQNLSLPIQRYLKGETQNIGQACSNVVTTSQLQNLFQGGNNVIQNQQGNHSDALKQLSLRNSSFGARLIGANNHVHGNSSFDSDPVFPAFGMEPGILTSSNAFNGGSKFGEQMFQNNGLLGTQDLSYGLGVGNTNLPLNSALDYNNSVSSGILNNGNSFGLLNGTQNADVNNSVTPFALGQGNSGLVQGGYASDANNLYAREFAAPLVPNATPEGNNTSEILLRQLAQQLGGGALNVAGNEIQFDAGGSINEDIGNNQVDDELTKLFLLLEDKQLLNETGENIDANEFFNSDFSGTSHALQLPQEQQPQKAGDMIVPSTENNMNLPNESTTTTDKNPTQGNDGLPNWEPIFDQLIEDNGAIATNSVTGQDWDMDFFEEVFGTQANTSG